LLGERQMTPKIFLGILTPLLSRGEPPTANKILFALRWAGPRLLLGMVGTWCAIGPFILISAGSAGGVLTAVLFLLLLLCYAIVFMICFHLRWITLGGFVSEPGSRCASLFSAS